MKTTAWKRMTCMVMTLSLLLGLLPTAAFAAESRYSDVESSDWCSGYIQDVTERGLMNGTGDGTFSPNQTTSRGMIVTTQYRMAGSPAVEGSSVFPDVAEGQYYASPVLWASQTAIVNGYDDGNFGPNDLITREQLVTMLYRYAVYMGYDVSQTADLSQFEDADQISEYAKVAVSWAVAVGLLTGTSDTTLSPQGNATRAQLAAFLSRFCELFDGQTGGAYTEPEKTAVSNDEDSDSKDNDRKNSGSKSDGNSSKSGGSRGTGGGSTPAVVYYTVTFESNGGSSVASQKVESGLCAVAPATPTKEGYSFDGWYLDSGRTEPYDDSVPITSDVTLYAGWSQFQLNSDVGLLTADGTTSIGLYVSVENAEADKIVLSVFRDGEEIDSVNMYDDGNVETHRDDMMGDGVYSAEFLFDEPIAKKTELTFRASWESGTSNEIPVSFYPEIEAEDIEEMQELDDSIRDLVEDDGFCDKTTEEKKEVVEEFLRSDDRVQEDTICYNEESSIVGFQDVSGILCGVMLEEFDDTLNGVGYDEGDLEWPELETAVNSVEEVNESHGTLGSALVLNSFPAFETTEEKIKYRTEFYETLQSEWNELGLATTLDTDVTVEDYMTRLDDYDVVCLSSHGTIYSYSDSDSGVKVSIPLIILAEQVSEEKNKQYELQLQSRQIAKVTLSSDGTKRYCLLPDLIENSYSNKSLNGTFIFSECCEFMGADGSVNEKMANAFLSCSAKAVVGFHNSVYAVYSRELMKTYVNGLLENKTAGDALDAACSTWGSTHKEWYEKVYGSGKYPSGEAIAYPILRGDSSAGLQQNGMKNMDFETYYTSGSVSIPGNWSAEGDVRSLTQLGEITPKEAKRMAIITTGIGSKETAAIETGVEGSQIYQRFTVPKDVTSLSFDYNFVSEEPMEWVGTQFNDYFAVKIIDDTGTVSECTYESINTATWMKVEDVDFSGGDDTAYQTGWKSATVDLSSYRGKSVTLSFIIYDTGDSIYDSACLIDNVVLN